jgi:hypothetical protein
MLLYLLSYDQIPNFYALMFLKSLLPTFTAGILLFGVSDEVCKRCKLYDSPDLDKDNSYMEM